MQGENNQSRQLNLENESKAFEEATLESIRDLIQQRVSPDKNIVKAKPDNQTSHDIYWRILAVIQECQKEKESPTWNVWLLVEERLQTKHPILL